MKLSKEAQEHLDGLLLSLSRASTEDDVKSHDLEEKNAYLEKEVHRLREMLQEERRRSSQMASAPSDSKPDAARCPPSVSDPDAFCVKPAEKGSCTVTMDDDGSQGIGVTAAAAISIASARAWAGFARDTASSKSRRFAEIPARSSYRLITSLDSCHSTVLFPGEKNFRTISFDPLKVDTGCPAPEMPDLDSDPVMPRPRGASLSLQWLEDPKTVLVVSKPSPDVMEQTGPVVQWLRQRGLCVFVEPRVYTELIKRPLHTREVASERAVLRHPSEVQHLYETLHHAQHTVSPRTSAGLARETSVGRGGHPLGAVDEDHSSAPDVPSANGAKMGGLMTWREDGGLRTLHEVTEHLDLIVTLGGDGTVLWTCSLFDNRPVPPVVAFSMGSLGFMAPFAVQDFEDVLDRALAGDFPLSIRHRLHCRIFRTRKEEEGAPSHSPLIEDHVVLNEVAFDRGMSPFLTKLECWADNSYVTTVQGDGLIIASPSGSTAYSLSAGGCMVHPAVPAVLMTPICAHSLSFRPLVFPEHVRLAVQVPHDSRSTTWCSFDGKERQQISAGDSVFVRVSRFPVPIVCRTDSTLDWFSSLAHTLGWNQRVVQGGPVPTLGPLGGGPTAPKHAH